MKKNLLVNVLILSLFLFGCATTKVRFERLNKARRDIRGLRRLAVLDFQSYGGRPESGRAASDLLVSGLLGPEFYEIIERQRIDDIIAEHKFNLSGMVSDTTVRKMGQLLGVDAVICGTVTGYKVENQRGYTTTPGRYDKETGVYAPPQKRYYTIKSGNVAVSYRMINIETGQIIAAKSNSQSYSKKRYDNALFRLPSDDTILNDLLKKVTAQFVAEISPHYVNKKRKLEKGKKSYHTKQGVHYAKLGLWDAAAGEWQKAIEKDPQDAWAHNNLGITYEKQGEINKAKREYQKASELNPAEKRYKEYLQDLASAHDKAYGEYLATGSFKMIIRRKGDVVYIDLGKKHEVEAGEVFIVYREVAVKHPVTNEVIGSEEERIGKIKVVNSLDQMSTAEVIKEDPENKIKVKDKVRKRGTALEFVTGKE
jgi:curli biogenesis system outer membrane secretion channel CsgG